MTAFRVKLNDKPRDLLVSLVDDGPQHAYSLAKRFGSGSVYTGGLNLLHELGLVQLGRPAENAPWEATEAGRRLVEAARKQEGDHV